MAIIDYKGGISKDTNVLGNKVYFDNGHGQGCGTIWFKDVGEAERFERKHGRIDARASGLCKKCRCNYSSGTEEYKKYPDFACKKWKEKIKRGTN